MNKEGVQSGVQSQPWREWLPKTIDNVPNMSKDELAKQPWLSWKPEKDTIPQGTEKPWNQWLTTESTREMRAAMSTGSG